MQDPSQGVARPLQDHVHLISGHRYPTIQNLNLQQVLKYLTDAPSVVKQIAPMAWTYVQAPPEGSLWLEWIPPYKNQQPFASDGYVWGDPETRYRETFSGYEIEMMGHSTGYKPGQDQFASHARTRYHIVRKDPNTPAPNPDPALWVVHYHRADRAQSLPVTQVPMHPHMNQVMGQRRWLESQGRLERRDFMLHDREHWPTINVPSSGQTGQQAQYGVAATPNRYYPQGPGQPPAKRQRQSGPNPMPGAMEGLNDQSIEEEENTAYGDYFDNLSAREISMARYMQHHQWMEEVFSSPYASGQIVPADLGLGLMGTLKGLTDGILQPPDLDELHRPADRPIKPKEAKPFTHLKQEQIEEFNKRVQKHLDEGQVEIERMKSEHKAKMQQWTKAKKLTAAEKKLRSATWEGHDSAVPAFRFEEQASNGHIEPKSTVEDVLKDIESELGVKIESHPDATMIEKGGLEKEERLSRDPSAQPDPMNQQQLLQPMFDQQSAQNTANGTPQPAAPTQAQELEPQMAANVPQPTFSPAPHGQSPMPPAQAGQIQQQQTSQADQSIDVLPEMGGNNDLMNDINMDIDNTAFDFEEPSGQEQPPDAAAQSMENPSAAPSDAAVASAQQEVQQQQQQQEPSQQTQQQETAPSEPSAAPGESTLNDDALGLGDQITGGTGLEDTGIAGGEGLGDVADTSMFNDNTFADLADFGGDADNGIVDFDGGIGMDNDAFGDAMHGMDTPGEDQQQAGEGGN